MRLESQVREESMVADRNGKSACTEHDEKERDLKPIDSDEIEIGRNRSQREEQGSNEKQTGRPIDFCKRDSLEHVI